MKGFLGKYLKIISVLKNAWRVLKKLRSTTRSTRVKFGLKLFYILKHFNKSEFVVPKLLLRKNEEDPETNVADSGHVEYRKFVSDFMTSLILFATIHSKRFDCPNFAQA